MNEKLKNYATTPDPEVWEKIEKSVRHRAVRRQAWTAAAGAVIVALAVVGVVSWPSSEVNDAIRPAGLEVAQVTTANEQQALAQVQEAVVVDEAASQSHPDHVGDVKSQQMTVAEPIVAKPASSAEVVVAQAQPVAEPQAITAAVASVSAQAVPQSVATAVAESEPIVLPVSENAVTDVSQPKSTIGGAEDDTVLWMPNIFVPGSDDEEINMFRVRLTHPGDVLTNFRMNIFNRLGNLVFMTNDINEAWDGRYRGRDMPQSTYVYVISYTDKDGLRHQRKGTVTLVR